MNAKALVLVFLSLALPGLAVAQDPSDQPSSARDRERASAPSERRFRLDLRLNGLLFDNFFQAPDGAPQEDVEAYAAELRLAVPFSEAVESYANLQYTTYEDPLDPSQGAMVGLRSSGQPHGFDLFVEYVTDRPTADIGDLVEQADVGRVVGEYNFRPTPAWQLSALAEVQRQDFALRNGKDNTFAEAGPAVRYRGFGSAFSPEIGATFGDREADDPAEDYRQQDLFLKIRSAPADWAYLTLRYRYRTRDYSTDDPLASNFEREDTRNQWVATADLRTGDVLTWNLYYSYEDADSTRETRVFTTSLFAAGVTIGLSELWGW